MAWDSQGRGRTVVLKAVMHDNVILLFLFRAGTEPPVPSSGPGKSPFSRSSLLCAEVLVKVVELYFCERCGQSFQEASLLSQHECLLLPPPEHLRLPGVLPAPTSKGQNEPGGSESAVASVPEGSALECLLCPICQEAFAQPGELKEHFKTHRGPQGTLPCPEKGCCFVTEDRKQLRSHLRLLHGTSPVSCTYRACPLLFPSRPAMEQHHRTHFPFHCGHCDFVTANAKLFWQHRKSHVAETSVMSSIPSSASLKQLCILPSGIAKLETQAGSGACGCCRGWVWS